MHILRVIILLLVVGTLCGCHAAKGLGQDIKESTTTAGEKIQQADSWMQEHMW
jgi:predicted small secreted protein